MEPESDREIWFENGVAPPPRLFSRIMGRLRLERRIAEAKRRSKYFAAALGASAAVFSTAALWLTGALIQSKIAQIFSLVFSDPQAVGQSWQNFGLFLVESLPVLDIGVFLAALFTLLTSLRYLFKYSLNASSLTNKTAENF